ncbi:hypothetical protein [Furfurilactobacillus rossiae]|uniref:Uncharacterized protein n=1 Tax=Furfurilactobacillus rossiae DSM 15814 TaxID=1114972 RepID=A0A0R1RNU5_9LACO|nr:hypothetical protein [Furfurilactobacillus rossiae]KRL55794.1 hypothetical protein FD35_GL002325 [Furfurilactobacillus rossiae DSM 15814]MCF6165982.1 hypothetical protein [Furfurilactobacillus rossiae]QFR67258.1 hypothetical protein LR814_09150 [Furfurilactobacillus rossiae]
MKQIIRGYLIGLPAMLFLLLLFSLQPGVGVRFAFSPLDDYLVLAYMSFPFAHQFFPNLFHILHLSRQSHPREVNMPSHQIITPAVSFSFMFTDYFSNLGVNFVIDTLIMLISPFLALADILLLSFNPHQRSMVQTSKFYTRPKSGSRK